MTDCEILTQFRLESAADWGREVACIDNKKLARVVWRESTYQHRQAIMREMTGLPSNVAGREARRLFAASYDEAIDFSIPPHGRFAT